VDSLVSQALSQGRAHPASAEVEARFLEFDLKQL